MREMLEEKLARFTELEGMMMDPEVLGNSSKLAAVAREHGGLAKLAGLYRNFKNVVAELGELKEMAASDDAEEQELKDLVKMKMEQAVKLQVPLIVDIGEGANWLDAH